MSRPPAPRLVIRADASTEIGFGHLMRCVALGQAWKGLGGEVAFVTTCSAAWLLGRLRSEAFDVYVIDSSRDEPAWAAIGDAIGANSRSCIVLDGYGFDADDQRRAKELGDCLLVIDDMADLPRYHADLILNSALAAERLHYPCDPSAELLLGPSHVLLRQEFLRWRNWNRTIRTSATNVLVSLGGTDPFNVVSRVLPALIDIGGHDLDIVVAGAPREGDYRPDRSSGSNHHVRFETEIDDMSTLMAWADIAVSGAGSTCWEMAFMGLPNVCITLADNQSTIGEGLARRGVALNVGRRERVTRVDITAATLSLVEDRGKRAAMSAAGRSLIDGCGARRVAEKCWRCV